MEAVHIVELWTGDSRFEAHALLSHSVTFSRTAALEGTTMLEAWRCCHAEAAG